MDKMNTEGSHDEPGRMEDPKEVKNWRVHLYCMGVCFGGVALGTHPSSSHRLNNMVIPTLFRV